MVITAITDDAPGEGRFYGFDTTFPHSLAACSDKHRALRVTPIGTDLTVATALTLIVIPVVYSLFAHRPLAIPAPDHHAATPTTQAVASTELVR